MADQELKVWAKDLVSDPVKGNGQKRPIEEEEWLQGWGRLSGVTAQQLNTIFNLLTKYAAPSDICPYPFPDDVPLPSNVLHMNGQALVVSQSPTLYGAYGTNLKDMTADNLDGFIWVVRNH
ncbi:hypothetical protein NVP1121O_062 [Vibrio phage 1.121.O._10N.286.46.C4]|nr:hypothetical protein NVP1121O_062 [Vibrio phage 1.121.O._10N.286.46.C4]